MLPGRETGTSEAWARRPRKTCCRVFDGVPQVDWGYSTYRRPVAELRADDRREVEEFRTRTGRYRPLPPVPSESEEELIDDLDLLDRERADRWREDRHPDWGDDY